MVNGRGVGLIIGVFSGPNGTVRTTCSARRLAPTRRADLATSPDLGRLLIATTKSSLAYAPTRRLAFGVGLAAPNGRGVSPMHGASPRPAKEVVRRVSAHGFSDGPITMAMGAATAGPLGVGAPRPYASERVTALRAIAASGS